MNFHNPYLTITQKIEMLQRWILFHSYCYYNLDTNFVQDSVYDNNAHLLQQMMENHPSDAQKSRYANIYKGYDGNSGYFLIEALEDSPEIKDNILFDAEIALRRNK